MSFVQKKRVFARILAVIFCFFTPLFTIACSKAEKKEENEKAFQATEDILYFKKPEPTYQDAWDLSDVHVSKIDKTKKLISFTFDDAPTHNFERLVAVFAEYNAQNPDCVANATVFYNGTYLQDNQVGAQAALTVGFEFANHTDKHLNLSKLSDEEIRQEIDAVDILLEKLDGKKRHLFRAPYGSLLKESAKQVPAPIINWSIDTLDWDGKTADEIFNAVMDGKQSGAIVLMHDGYEQTIQAVKRLLPALKKENYQVVSVSQMAKTHGCTLKIGSTYTRARRPSEIK